MYLLGTFVRNDDWWSGLFVQQHSREILHTYEGSEWPFFYISSLKTYTIYTTEKDCWSLSRYPIVFSTIILKAIACRSGFFTWKVLLRGDCFIWPLSIKRCDSSELSVSRERLRGIQNTREKASCCLQHPPFFLSYVVSKRLLPLSLSFFFFFRGDRCYTLSLLDSCLCLRVLVFAHAFIYLSVCMSHTCICSWADTQLYSISARAQYPIHFMLVFSMRAQMTTCFWTGEPSFLSPLMVVRQCMSSFFSFFCLQV